MTYFIDQRTQTLHKSVCPQISLAEMIMLDVFLDDDDALTDAKSKGYRDADGCWYCCSSCCSDDSKSK